MIIEFTLWGYLKDKSDSGIQKVQCQRKVMFSSLFFPMLLFPCSILFTSNENPVPKIHHSVLEIRSRDIKVKEIVIGSIWTRAGRPLLVPEQPDLCLGMWPAWRSTVDTTVTEARKQMRTLIKLMDF